jgi:hypothetical protein
MPSIKEQEVQASGSNRAGADEPLGEPVAAGEKTAARAGSTPWRGGGRLADGCAHASRRS